MEGFDGAKTADDACTGQSEMEEEDCEEEVVLEEPTVAESVQAGITRGDIEMERESVPIDQRELDETEEKFV